MAVGISAGADLILARTVGDCLVVSKEDEDEDNEEVNEDGILMSEDDEVLVREGDKVLVSKGIKVFETDSERGLRSTVSD